MSQVQTETLSDYWPCRQVEYDGKVVGLFSCRGDNECWSTRWLLDGDWDDEEIAYAFNIGSWYSGPGMSFGNEPIITRNGHSTLIYQSGGLDI